MDILIENMKMPQGDIPLVLIIASDGTVEEIDDSDEINETEAKAIEIPPHGEAKDTDIAIEYIKSEMEDDFNETTTLDEKSYKEGMKRAIELIGYAPIVLEAST